MGKQQSNKPDRKRAERQTPAPKPTKKSAKQPAKKPARTASPARKPLDSSPRSTLSERDFEKMAAELRDLKSQAEAASVDSTLETYWGYGDVITRRRLLDEAGYHNSILRDLARETGISGRTLQQSVAFRKLYDEPPSGQHLTWSHWRVLIRVPHKRQRNFYARLAHENDWSSKELQQAISADLYSGGQLDTPQLERPTDASYLYRVAEARVIDGDTLEVLVDLGFESFTRKRLRLAQVNAPEGSTAQARAARTFLVEQIATAATVVISSHKADLHGRYVAHLFVSPNQWTVRHCFREGRHVNDLLVQAGLAHVVG